MDLVIILVPDSKVSERVPRKCRSCGQQGHDVRNCPQLIAEEKELKKRRKMGKAECDKNSAQPKVGRSAVVEEEKRLDADEDVEEKEEPHNRNGLEIMFNDNEDKLGENELEIDDCVVDNGLLEEWSPILFFCRKTDFYITKMHGNKTNKRKFATTLLRHRRDQTLAGVGSEKNNRIV